MVDHSEINLNIQDQNKLNTSIIMSAEELKIRGELEKDVEKDLEEEIKDGIYHLALRLHRLYQHQKDRNGRELSELSMKNQRGIKNNTLSEVNINIKMEGGTTIVIKEIKKEGRPKTFRSENMQGIVGPNTKKFDWAKTLRSGPGPVGVNKKNYNSHEAKMLNVREKCTATLGNSWKS